MAYWLTKLNNTSMVKEFQCDFLSDIGKLPTSLRIGVKQKNENISNNPCAPGSSCLCYEDGSEWLLGMETDTWVKMGSKYNGSTGGGDIPGTTSYNQLSDVPMKNMLGNVNTPVILSELQPDMYKVKGSYCVTRGSEIESAKGDVFFVSGTGNILGIYSEGISLITVYADGTYSVSKYQTEADISQEILNQLDTDIFDIKISNLISKSFSTVTDSDIESLFT